MGTPNARKVSQEIPLYDIMPVDVYEEFKSQNTGHISLNPSNQMGFYLNTLFKGKGRNKIKLSSFQKKLIENISCEDPYKELFGNTHEGYENEIDSVLFFNFIESEYVRQLIGGNEKSKSKKIERKNTTDSGIDVPNTDSSATVENAIYTSPENEAIFETDVSDTSFRPSDKPYVYVRNIRGSNNRSSILEDAKKRTKVQNMHAKNAKDRRFKPRQQDNTVSKEELCLLLGSMYTDDDIAALESSTSTHGGENAWNEYIDAGGLDSLTQASYNRGYDVSFVKNNTL